MPDVNEVNIRLSCFSSIISPLGSADVVRSNFRRCAHQEAGAVRCRRGDDLSSWLRGPLLAVSAGRRPAGAIRAGACGEPARTRATVMR